MTTFNVSKQKVGGGQAGEHVYFLIYNYVCAPPPFANPTSCENLQDLKIIELRKKNSIPWAAQ